MIDNAQKIFEEYVGEYASSNEMSQKDINALFGIDWKILKQNHEFVCRKNKIKVTLLGLITFNGHSVLCWEYISKELYVVNKVQTKSEIEQLIKEGYLNCFMAIKKEYFSNEANI